VGACYLARPPNRFMTLQGSATCCDCRLSLTNALTAYRLNGTMLGLTRGRIVTCSIWRKVHTLFLNRQFVR
jgi:hypothetical protein